MRQPQTEAVPRIVFFVKPASRIKARSVPLASSRWFGMLRRRRDEWRRMMWAAGLMIERVANFDECFDRVFA
jgi:hypothetical protein